MATGRDIDVAGEIGSLTATVDFLKDRIERMEVECKKENASLKAELERRISPIEQWKGICDGIAKGWAYLLFLASGIAGFVAHYWDTFAAIYSRFKGSGQ